MAQPQPRVLVITAVHSIYTLIQRPLKAQGFHTTHALSGDKAQTYLEDETHHLTILDLTHVRQKQIDDYDRLRQRTTIPLIVLINSDSEQYNETITDIVIDDYLYYPFDPENFLARVRNALRPRPNQATQRPDLHLGTTTINFDERQAMCNGHKIHLTRTEWKLLETLALHHGKTLTYRTLLQQVWGDAYHDEHSYVHTYVSQLRRKLETDPAKPCYLLTEVGVGYRLEASTNGTRLPELTADSPPEETTETPLKLTTPPTKLFGRETDTQRIQHLLGQADVRLLTLTGPPGVGKTRLAQHIAETIQHRFTDGLYTVSLAPLRDHSLVISAIAQAVGAKESAHQTIHEALVQTLKDQKALLLLDNFEHVLEAAPLITELITTAPDLTILVTSRTPLRIAGEQEYPVLPLTTPDPTIPASPETLEHNPAVALFVRRSQAVKPDFVLTDENAPAVAAICTRLDGLPLAIELAAARSKLFSPQALLARLDQRLALLSHNTTDAPERHQTLRAAIDWSYQLLRPEEQHILVGLSVFAGSCTLEAATSVLSNDQQLLPETSSPTTSLSPDHQTLTMINHLTTLVNHSLVQIKEDTTNETRFVLLETIREYAWEKLAESGEVEKMQQMFVEYYTQFAEQAEIQLRGPEQITWLEQLELERNNLRTVLDYSIKQNDVNTASRVAKSIWRFWCNRNHLKEGQKSIENILEHFGSSIPLTLQSHLLNGIGAIVNLQGDYMQATKYFKACLKVRQELQDTQGVARTLGNIGMVATQQVNYEQAQLYQRQCLELCQKVDDIEGKATALGNLAQIALVQGHYSEAYNLCSKSLEIHRDEEDIQSIVIDLLHLAEITFHLGYKAKSCNFYIEQIAVNRELKNISLMCAILESIASRASEQQHWVTVACLLSVAKNLHGTVGSTGALANQQLIEQMYSGVKTNLSDQEQDIYYEKGRLLSIDEATDFALEYIKSWS
ncbi:MAG: winged helix-turn-helix domain-containing protein [Chloroflexota bacterium]